jgi:hypothetical protein
MWLSLVLGAACVASADDPENVQDTDAAYGDSTDCSLEDACGAAVCCDGCCGCGTCRRTRWYASADALWLHRDREDGNLPLFGGELGNLDLEPGARVAVGCECANGCGLQAIYFGIDGWNKSRSFEWTEFGGGQLEGSYRSELYNGELNLRKRLGESDVHMLAGFRWMQLSDTLRIDVDSNAFGSAIGSSNVDNYLYGLQIGGEGSLWRPLEWLSFDGLVKAGIYANHASLTNSIDAGRLVLSQSANTDHTAFVGEASVAGVVQVTKCLALRAGYQLLWLEGVALAPQIQLSRHPGVNTDGSPFYQGLFVGLQADF